MARTRDFNDAVALLDSLIPKVRKPPPAKHGTASPTQLTNQEAMAEGMKLLGITQDALKKLNVIHIAGTKGKGSTACMCEAMLRKLGYKTALFTSPHLISVTERLRINGAPMDEDVFTGYFFDVWDALSPGELGIIGGNAPKASFFRFLTQVALHAFSKENVDVVILEVGLGGRLDSTNVVDAPVVCGISHIGYDHVEVLGDTLTLIASEKGGICKKGVPVVLSPNQDPEAQTQLLKSAADAGAPCITAPAMDVFGDVPLGLKGVHQKDNASLAVGLVAVWLARMQAGERGEEDSTYSFPDVVKGTGPLRAEMKEALGEARWDGRCQVVEINGGKLRVFLDGAHTDASVQLAFNWFCSEHDTRRAAKLLFFCQPERSYPRLLSPFASAESPLQHAIFVPTLSSKTTIHSSNDLPPDVAAWLQAGCEEWSKLVPSTPASVSCSLSTCLQELVDESSQSPHGIDVFVTGSLYLVGDVLKLAKTM